MDMKLQLLLYLYQNPDHQFLGDRHHLLVDCLLPRGVLDPETEIDGDRLPDEDRHVGIRDHAPDQEHQYEDDEMAVLVPALHADNINGLFMSLSECCLMPKFVFTRKLQAIHTHIQFSKTSEKMNTILNICD